MKVCMVGYDMMAVLHSEALLKTDAVLHTVAPGFEYSEFELAPRGWRPTPPPVGDKDELASGG